MGDTASIEDQRSNTYNDNDDDSIDTFPEFFRCCVCLDVLYKPIVLGCGHISCFWCVHRAMSGLRQSHCPICRHPYHHFPSICQLLHFLLLKIDPVAYKRKENQVLEEEKKSNRFSPQFDDYLNTEMEDTRKEPNLLVCSPSSSSNCFSLVDAHSDPSPPEKSDSPVTAEPLDCHSSHHNNVTTAPEKSCPGNVGQNTTYKENKFPESGPEHGICKTISVADVLCFSCKRMLFRPMVLNCGHVYCESCIVIIKDESLRCQACQSLHPGGFPKVCLEFDHFLEQEFPQEYALRREAHLMEQTCYQQCPVACAAQAEKRNAELLQWPMKNDFSWWHEHASKVHIGVGCDSCGMYPIIGKRYKCRDCVEAIGFDLCEECYETRSKLPGRFNQRHTPDHRFELVRSSMFRNIVLRLVAEQSDDGSGGSILSDDAPEDPENTDSTI